MNSTEFLWIVYIEVSHLLPLPPLPLHSTPSLCGSVSDRWRSVGVVSDGVTYGVPQGLYSSFLMRCEGGEWKPVGDGVELSSQLLVYVVISCKRWSPPLM